MLLVQAGRLQVDLRPSRSDRINLSIQNRMNEREISELTTTIGRQIEEKEQMITNNAIAQNLNDEQQTELRDRLATAVREREAIGRTLEQTSIVLNEQIDNLRSTIERKDNELAILVLERVESENKIVNLDIELNQQREQQNILLERQQVNNETLANAQNELADSNERNSELTRRLEMLSVRSIAENASLQGQINVISQGNRTIITQRDQLSREVQEKNNRIRRLRSAMEVQDNDSRNTQDRMQETIAQLTNDKDSLNNTITSLTNTVNERTNSLNFLAEERTVLSAQLRAAENTILDFRRRLFSPTE